VGSQTGVPDLQAAIETDLVAYFPFSSKWKAKKEDLRYMPSEALHRIGFNNLIKPLTEKALVSG